MIRTRIYLYIFTSFLIIGLIYGLISYSLVIFITWIFLGAWGAFTIKFLEKIKYARELNSPHNTIFFLLSPLLIGFFFLFWGHYTPFLNQNLFQTNTFYLSPWILIFSLPYLIYSLISILFCFRKYDFVYIGRKSFEANKFAILLSILWILLGLLLSFWGDNLSRLIRNIFSITVTTTYYDSLILIFIAIAGVILLYGFFKKRTPLPEINQDLIARRRERVSNIQNAQPRSIESSRTTTRPRSRSRSSSTSSRSRTANTSRSRTKRSKKTKRKTKPKRKPKTVKKSVKLGQLKPRSGNLTIDDFKCIHCFRLPELPKDDGRGIVVCPHCRYPSHADEFKSWLQNSTLCSRCDTPLPKSYVRNPPIIPIDIYLKAMKKLLK